MLLVGDRYQFVDLDSTNGTRVNGETVTEVFLKVGDRLRFGKVEARYESEKTGEAQALPETDEIEARPAETSEKPADFANASPFPNRKKEKDTVARRSVAAGAIAIVAMLLSLLNLLRMHGPRRPFGCPRPSQRSARPTKIVPHIGGKPARAQRPQAERVVALGEAFA